jgi:hypothetical protein
MPEKPSKTSPRLIRPALKKESFTADELIADPDTDERIDSVERRVTALEREAEETPGDLSER